MWSIRGWEGEQGKNEGPGESITNVYEMPQILFFVFLWETRNTSKNDDG